MTQNNDVARSLKLFSTPGAVIEIRPLNCHDGNPDYTHTRTGYYDSDHLAEAEAAALEAEAKWHASGVYVTLNPVMTDVLGRAANRLRKTQKNESTKDVEILTRRWLLLDFDPKRPAGISSSEVELEAAEDLARNCGIWLCDHGFPLPVVAMSGNGWHLLFRVDLPADDEKLVERCLMALDQAFSTPAINVDTTVFNPARITKLYGTLVRKGDHTEERPHRRSKLLEVPDDLQTVPRERLEWLAGQYVAPQKPESGTTNGHGSGESLNIEKYLSRNSVRIISQEAEKDGGRKYFIPCPGESSHTTPTNPRDCVITQELSGKLWAKCFHSSCGMRDWASLRDVIGKVTQDDFPDSEQSKNTPKSPAPESRGNKPPQTQGKTGVSYLPPQVFTPFPLEILPGSIREFCTHHARSICCDPTLILLPVLATCATAIGNSRRVVIRKTWSEPAILWTIPVADSGSGKSPAFDAATAPLKKLQKDAIRAWEQEMARYKSDKSLYDQQQKGRKGIESIPEPVLPVLPDVFLEDTTVEAIAPALVARPRGSAIICEELSGWFQRLNAYKTKGGGDEAFYLQAHGGRSTKVNRKGGRTVFIPSTVLSITGTIQRPILKEVLSRSHIGSGMAARFLFSMPPEQIRKWSDDEVPADVINNYNQMIYRLSELPMEISGFDDPEPAYLGMTVSAQNRFKAFYNEIGATRPDIDTSEMKAAWSKLEGGAARLALVFACCRFVMGDKTRGVVDDQDIESGIIASRWFASEAERIYSMLKESDQEFELRELVSFIQSQGGSILPRDLAHKKRRYRDAGAADAVLQTLVNSGCGNWTEISTTSQGGRPARVFNLTTTVTVTNPENSLRNEGLLPRPAQLDDSEPATWPAHEELSEEDFAQIGAMFP